MNDDKLTVCCLIELDLKSLVRIWYIGMRYDRMVHYCKNLISFYLSDAGTLNLVWGSDPVRTSHPLEEDEILRINKFGIFKIGLSILEFA